MSPMSIPRAYHKALPARHQVSKITVRLFALTFCLLIGAPWNTASGNTVVHVYITPATPSLPSTLTQKFTAKVTGTIDLEVKWTATKGSVSSACVFTAPTVSADTTVSVTATSVADPAVSATAVV